MSARASPLRRLPAPETVSGELPACRFRLAQQFQASMLNKLQICRLFKTDILIFFPDQTTHPSTKAFTVKALTHYQQNRTELTAANRAV
ncbi:hypothetical protein A8D95_18390 [Burkholderia cenocepacia]|uniref:Uncharacterized protein n=1 Tax=Burkholderia cenocepacia TaxID=95486 RepID=A0A1V2W180_9BURK|nr:hypothetical protein A8D83_24390 [Burkholderia cenocepacia]WJN72801.1 hypothetical protein OH687_21070 [Burkholderia anthina]ONJ21087.1 hypothetical protein A8D90_19270 [Burkholderia cenocepacia]ONP20847.1 hypothetical protein A8D84_30205 [Burkholderia cenocepacia]ONP35986.1 hypothetical protein A8D85_22870 [Burkholderia cenocepacia]